LGSFYIGPSWFTPPRSQKGLRAKNCGDIILKWAENVNENKNTGDSRQKAEEGQRREEWNGGRMPEDQ
jgi:hypothetical protein